jgi:predicted site-specific integrase-resolvase
MTKKSDNDEYMTITDAAKLLGVYEKTIANWFDRGYIEGKKTILGTRKPSRASIMKIKKKLEGGWRPRNEGK